MTPILWSLSLHRLEFRGLHVVVLVYHLILIQFKTSPICDLNSVDWTMAYRATFLLSDLLGRWVLR